MDRRTFLRAGAMGLAGMLLSRPAFCRDPVVSIIPLLVEYGGVRWGHPSLGNLAQEFSAIYRVEARVAAPLSLVGSDASDVLRAVGAAGYDYAIGLTSAPLVRSRGVSGLAKSPGRAAIVTDYWRKSASAKVTQRRLLDVMVHEFGHNLGAADCDDYGCNMYNDPTVKRRRLDGRPGVYCDIHRMALEKWLR